MYEKYQKMFENQNYKDSSFDNVNRLFSNQFQPLFSQLIYVWKADGQISEKSACFRRNESKKADISVRTSFFKKVCTGGNGDVHK